MTTFGLVILIFLIISLCLPYRYTVIILIVSCIFQVSSVVNLGSTIIAPYLICEFFIIVRSYKSFLKLNNSLPRVISLVLLFLIWVVVISIFGPIFFENYMVVGKDLDAAYESGLDKLKFSNSNINQILYAILNFSTMIALYFNRYKVRVCDIERAFIISVIFSVFFGVWQILSHTLYIPFPEDFIFPGHGLYDKSVSDYYRMSSVFGEASYFGGYISAAFWGLYILKKSFFRYILLFLSFICVLVSFSGSAYVTFLFGFVLCLIHFKANYRNIKYFFILLFVLIVVIFTSSLGISILEFVNAKQDSESSAIRFWVTITSLSLFIDSWGLGIGLGSSRSSSFIVDLLTGTGLIGTILFVSFIIKLLWPLRKSLDFQFVYVYLLLLLVCMAFSLPDISFCGLWLGLHMAIICYRNKPIVVEKHYENSSYI